MRDEAFARFLRAEGMTEQRIESLLKEREERRMGETETNELLSYFKYEHLKVPIPGSIATWPT